MKRSARRFIAIGIGIASYLACSVILHLVANMIGAELWKPVATEFPAINDPSPPVPSFYVFLDDEFRPGEPTWFGFGVQVAALACAVAATLMALPRRKPRESQLR